MTRYVVRVALALTMVVLLGPATFAQTSTKKVAIHGRTGLTGSLGGSVNAQILPKGSTRAKTAGALFITDPALDLDGSGVVPNGGLERAKGSVSIAIANSLIDIGVPVQASTTGSENLKSEIGSVVSIPKLIRNAIFGRIVFRNRRGIPISEPRSRDEPKQAK